MYIVSQMVLLIWPIWAFWLESLKGLKSLKDLGKLKDSEYLKKQMDADTWKRFEESMEMLEKRLEDLE